jgi:two-component system, response regulator
MGTNQIEILYVEDNPNDLELTLHAFKKNHLANNILVARDGEEAIKLLFGENSEGDGELCNSPRVILLDLKLPKITGLEVLKKVKTDLRTRMIPVVVLTSSREERDIIDSYRLGVNSYIVKPVDFENFVESMRTLGLYWLLLNQPPMS